MGIQSLPLSISLSIVSAQTIKFQHYDKTLWKLNITGNRKAYHCDCPAYIFTYYMFTITLPPEPTFSSQPIHMGKLNICIGKSIPYGV